MADVLRYPAVPLLCHDPYFSVWSFDDNLTDSQTRHWTGKPHPLIGLIRINGRVRRYVGIPKEKKIEPSTQTSVTVHPTRTVYVFEDDGVRLTLTFTTPALPHQLDVLSRPVTYITWDVENKSSTAKRVEIAFAAQATLAVDSDSQAVVTSRYHLPGTDAIRVGASDQRILNRSGDDLRIDWGYLYLACPHQPGMTSALTTLGEFKSQFAKSGQLSPFDVIRESAPVQKDWPVIACAADIGLIKPKQTAARFAMIAYDDEFGVEYLHRRLRAYWARNGQTFAGLLETASHEYPSLVKQCASFDREFYADVKASGGEKYAQICALSYRQSIAAHKLAADLDGEPLFFSKENFSNGCIATVDVTYPSAPLFLLTSPALLKGMLTPILQYAQSARWRFPFAPHDLGTYPLANGQVYGGGEKTEENQMPVEECGNMLILLAALAKTDGNADYAGAYWPVVSQWAAYLLDKGLDPENQLCTDDFAGHLGHNVNLSAKAIVALRAYADLCRLRGLKTESQKFKAASERMVKKWEAMAADGDHYRLAFDRPGTWSLKYNLVWDKILGYNLFPGEIVRREIAHYLRVQTRYGLPLDCRKTYSKPDWSIWSATMANSERDFLAMIDPIWNWLNESPTRVPLTDWYETADGRQMEFQARSVVGGFFIKMLSNPSMRKKWSQRAAGQLSGKKKNAGGRLARKKTAVK